MASILSRENAYPIALGLVAILAVRMIAGWIRRPKYLPGPPRLPLVGNLFDMPESESWVTYNKWKETYGDAIYLEILGSPLVILNSYKACIDLLEKKSDIYSDRPIGIMANILMGWNKAVMMSPYNDRWRRFRRITAQSMRKDAIKQFHPIQEREVARFLGSLLEDPDHYMENFRLAAGRSLLWNVYGLPVDDSNNPIITTTEKAMEIGVFAAQPGNFLVDFFPALQYVPSWFPGTGWKEFARKGRVLAHDMAEIPFDMTLKEIKSGNNEPSFTSINLGKNEDPDIVKWCSGSMLAAGADTSVASVHAFFLTMTLFPEVQKRCQAEIDAVTGGTRLPEIADRDSLPFLSATMWEMMRWQPVSPLALPHRVLKDDIYNGCFIPAGTVILGNTWDPELFEEPDKFIPERYLPYFDKSIPHDPAKLPLEPNEFAFGYGRRICAGMHYAETMFLISIARVLSTFDITKVKDANGNEITPELKFNSSIVRETLEFPCVIKPRSEAARALVLSSLKSI
ncbi:cytochrome P450 [Gymnopilus junonius]|uniref:Cytochrome P450 n=1 Tax=Gymnopilus junonius TaxID=109634 RepID=A0A9P5TSH7_GYMJU|nr:cytochrome P450 [Gymnopilus junonius]